MSSYKCHPKSRPECKDQWVIFRSHTLIVRIHLEQKKSLVVVGGGRQNLVLAPGPGLGAWAGSELDLS